MKNEMKVLGYVSIILLIFVLMGQGCWLYQYRKIKITEFKTFAKFALIDEIQKYLSERLLDSELRFKCAVESDGRTFIWGNDKVTKLSSVNMYYEMARLVVYDYLYINNYFDLEVIQTSFQKALALKDITLDFILIIRDSTGKTVAASVMEDDLSEYRLETTPVFVGYECPHQITAIFREPPLYKLMMWLLIGELMFVIAYICCLYWQWNAMWLAWKNAKVQTMGIAHLEHELRKPLAIMNSALQKMLDKDKEELTETDFKKLRLIKLRIMKISEVTETMLTAIKDTVLTIDKTPINIHAEMELIKEMFCTLKSGVQLDMKIQEGIDHPRLDSVYFNILLINLIDNAIKYGGKAPVVMVDFSKKDHNFVLKVSDCGIGMSSGMTKHIFKQFYRGKEEVIGKVSGFGLGLTFVDKVVKAYGGTIHIDSQPGCGSTFTITFKDVEPDQYNNE